MGYIERPHYRDWLVRWKDKQVIKAVSGVRRCGKSTLLEMFRAQLQAEGVPGSRLISINFEDVAYEHLAEYHALHDYIADRLVPDRMTYVFLDEIQHVKEFEKALDSLHIKKNCDLYITGSNAHFMSTDLATLLTGRYVELKMLPLSFAEFFTGVNDSSAFESQGAPNPAMADEAFARYLRSGSFPYVLELIDDPKTSMEYLHDVYSSILFKDVMRRMNISDTSLLERIAKLLASSVGSLVSINKLANTLRSSGQSSDPKTIDKYIDGLVRSLLFYEAPRWDIKGRKLLQRISKYYIVDTGLRRNLVEGTASDLGHLLENIVYLDLLRRNGSVYVGALDDGEVDFVTVNGEAIEYYQVSASIMDSAVLERELASLRRIDDDHPKMLLTLDRILPTNNMNGIRVLNAVDWLLS